MKRIDYIADLQKKCTGCMACVDICPIHCIHSNIGTDGFAYSKIDQKKCISCGKCYNVCPIIHQEKHCEEQHLFAAYSKDNACRNNGSSGGLFELLANHFMDQGYRVCGAAFEKTKLKHRIAHTKLDIKPLLKSKYVQSNMEGIYNQIHELLEDDYKVFFCGTPCQVSALINSIPPNLRDNLFTADIVCHGVPSQKMFDDYIDTLKKKHKGEIIGFSFRVKDNKYKHAHGYSYSVLRNGKEIYVNGIYTDSSYYNAFKNYVIFRESCYSCQYATINRVSDITLADFWGIEKYGFDGDTDAGVSMIVANDSRGMNVLREIKEKVIFKEFPVQYGIDSNYCLTHQTQKPKCRDAVFQEITKYGYERTAEKYFKCSVFQRFYWLIPAKARNIIRKLRGVYYGSTHEGGDT